MEDLKKTMLTEREIELGIYYAEKQIDSAKTYDVKNINPTHGFAFKMVLSDQVAEVIVKDVVWGVTKHGYLKPVVQINPVNLVGVTIRNVTA